MVTAVAAFALVAMSSVWSVAQTTTPPPPPQLVAKLLDPLGHAAGEAGYGQQTDKTGKITASFLRVKIGPLPKTLVGQVLTVQVDSVNVGTAKVVAGTGTTDAHAELNLNSADKVKVPPVKPGSKISASYGGNPPIAQGKFQQAAPPK